MRCNDFISHSSTFQPHEMKGPAFLSLSDEHPSRSLLPRLKDLSLRGVHVDWSSLASILSYSHVGLRTLELASHCLDVRPSFPEFHRILTASAPSLKNLVVNGSGPYVPDDAEEDESILSDDDPFPVTLSNLKDITIGYRSSYEGQAILESISAPNAQVLTMEDSTHPSDPEDIDAGKLLTYLGTGRFYDANEHIFVSYVNGRHLEVTLDEPHSPTSVSEPRESTSPFPLLEKVALNGVKACSGPLHTFFRGLQNIRKLELSGMSAQAVHALRPSGSCPASASPCPHLQSLCIRRPECTHLQEYVVLVGALAVERLRKGACGLQDVDIHVDDTGDVVPEDIVKVSPCTTVTVFREHREDDDDMDYDEDGSPVDPYLAGGAFNDPAFDMFYARGVAPNF